MEAQALIANLASLALICAAIVYIVRDAIAAGREANERKAREAARAARMNSPEYRNAAFVAALLWAQGNAARVNGAMPADIFAAAMAAARKRDALARF